MRDSSQTIQQKQEKEENQDVTAEKTVQLEKLVKKEDVKDLSSSLKAKLKKKKQLPEVGRRLQYSCRAVPRSQTSGWPETLNEQFL